jgi:LPXTG-motif cell wall-anchored protein
MPSAQLPVTGAPVGPLSVLGFVLLALGLGLGRARRGLHLG